MTARERRARLPYVPALDGLRGLAVVAVLLFHSDFVWAKGGHLGVTAFFTLSGFLITGLLLVERETTGAIHLLGFWARRARRLVPAALLSFGLIAAVLALSDAAPPSGLTGDAVSAATWTANWRFVFHGGTYADLFSSPSPFQHFWSLAVEEQFYVVFPLLAVAVLGVRHRPPRRGLLAAVLVALVVASTVQAARLFAPGDAIGRAYYGTDARVAEILVGSLLALALVEPQGIRTFVGPSKRAAGALGIVAMAGLVASFGTFGDRDSRLYDGGFLAVAAFTAVVIMAAVQPGTLVGRTLALRPAVVVGRISYGAYLFHWPIFILLTEQSTGLAPVQLLVLRVAATLGLAALSYHLIEAPIRFGRVPAGVGLVGWANGAVAGLALVALASGQLAPPATSVATSADPTVSPEEVAAAGAAERAPDRANGDATVSALGAGKSQQVAAPQAQQPASPADEGKPEAPAGFFEDPRKAKVPPVPDAPPGALRVVMVGDSIGVNIGRGLQIWGEERTDVVVYNLAFPACPLSRGGERRFGNGEPYPVVPECGWWDDESSERRKAFEEFAPDVVVVQDGINEMFDRKLPEWEDYLRPGEPRFDRWLREEYQLAFTRWSAAGASIVVTNAPCADWERYERWGALRDADLRIRMLNVNVYGALIDVALADLFERICPAGQYRDDVEGVQYGRPDGFHLSDEAAAALARNWLGPIVLDAGEEAVPSPSPID